MKFIQVKSARSETEYTIFLNHIVCVSIGQDPNNSLIRVTNGDVIAVSLEYYKVLALIKRAHQNALM
jgi:hypothetical protein